MDPASGQTDSQFFRIHVGPHFCKGVLWWVSEAREPQLAADRKRAVYRHLALTDVRERSQVYPEATAAAVISILRTTYTAADLVPATFDEWVQAAGEAGK